MRHCTQPEVHAVGRSRARTAISCARCCGSTSRRADRDADKLDVARGAARRDGASGELPESCRASIGLLGFLCDARPLGAARHTRKNPARVKEWSLVSPAAKQERVESGLRFRTRRNRREWRAMVGNSPEANFRRDRDGKRRRRAAAYAVTIYARVRLRPRTRNRIQLLQLQLWTTKTQIRFY